jgi:hypothetical protein
MSDEIKKSTDQAEAPQTPATPELSDEALRVVTGGVKEAVSFEYGALQIKYKEQKSDGSSG